MSCTGPKERSVGNCIIATIFAVGNSYFYWFQLLNTVEKEKKTSQSGVDIGLRRKVKCPVKGGRSSHGCGYSCHGPDRN